jgi:hypothetical protein
VSAKKKAATVKTPRHMFNGFDLTTVEGSEAHEKDYDRRKAIAEDFFQSDFSRIEEHLDALDGLIISVMCDLAENTDYNSTVNEIARIARLSFMVRLVLPAKTEETVAP